MTVLYPGSFDPPTVGHVAMIRRACALFDRVVVLAIRNPGKPRSTPIATRLEWLRRCAGDLPNAAFEEGEGLLADCVRRLGADAILRGLRGEADWAQERPTANAFLQLYGMETVFLASEGALDCVSSSLVREVLRLGGDADPWVPTAIRSDVRAAYARSRED